MTPADNSGMNQSFPIQLTSDVYNRLTGEELPVDKSNRERLPRHRSCKNGATIQLLQKQGPSPLIPVGLRDISPGGICILQYRPLAVGQQFIAELTSLDNQTLRMNCSVRWCRRINEELYAMGAAFVLAATNSQSLAA